jgi:hypothetical protein
MIEILTTKFAMIGAQCNHPQFFGLKPWYNYLTTDGACNVQNFQVLNSTSGGTSDFLLIALVLVDDLLRIAGLVAIAFIIYGGFLYLTSEGSPDQTQQAQNTIKNSLIGLIIAVVAVSFVSFIGNRLGA